MSRDRLGHDALLAGANFKPLQWRATIAGRFPRMRPNICTVTARDEKEAQRIAESMMLPGETLTLERLP